MRLEKIWGFWFSNAGSIRTNKQTKTGLGDQGWNFLISNSLKFSQFALRV